MNNRLNCSGCCCKLTLVIAILALIVAATAYFCPRSSLTSYGTTFDEKVKGIILETAKQNPQLFMNAMEEGAAKQREDQLKRVEQEISEKIPEISKLAHKYGQLESKTSVVCFFDPLERNCIELLKEMLRMVKEKKDVCFKLLPVAALGEDSVVLAKVYIAVYEKSPEKSVRFIEKITSVEGDMDKKAIEKALKEVDLDPKEIEGMLGESDKKLVANGQLAENIHIPVVPAIFLAKDGKTTMLRLKSANQLEEEIDKK